MRKQAVVSDKDTGKAVKATARDRKMLLSGVIVLTVANIIVKLVGVIYKVPLNSMVGSEMANINAAYSVYTVLYMISTAGIPVAVSKLISESRARGDVKRVNRIYNVTFTLLTVVGVVITLLMIFTSGWLSEWNSGGDTQLCIIAIAPALFFICIASVYRGYFQGFQIMTPTAVSEIIESLGKMAIGLSMVYLALNAFGRSEAEAAALSIVGIDIGIALGVVYLMIAKIWYTRKGKLHMFGTAEENPNMEEDTKVLPRLLRLAIPIAASSVVMNLAALVDSQMMRPLLERFFSAAGQTITAAAESAKMWYAHYSTSAVTLYNLPLALVYPISAAIVPYISASLASGDRKNAARVMESALRVAAIIALPCAFGMCALGPEIVYLIFGDAELAVNGGLLLRVLAFSVFLAGMLSLTNAILQSNGKANMPIISMGIGLIVKLAAGCILISTYGPIGAPISTVLFHLTVLILNFYFLTKATGLIPSVTKIFFKPLAASLLCGGAAFGAVRLLESLLPQRLAVIMTIPIAILVYMIAILLFRGITEEELSMVPAGKKLGRILNRFRLLR